MSRRRAAPIARTRRRRGAWLTPLGAAGEVTGSCYLLEAGGHRVLLECGLFQGGYAAERRNAAALRFDPADIDAIVLSHAHLDHSGLLPRVVRAGYSGPVYATPATIDLLQVMLRDAAHLQERDAEWENKRRRRAGRDPIEPLYTVADAEATLELCVPVDYHRPTAILDDLTLTYHDAGHILGSAVVDLRVVAEGRPVRVVFSGDLGNAETALLRDPESVDGADLMLVESTYGDRDHRPIGETIEELAEALAAAAASGGNVIVPAFAVGRTQELLYRLGTLHRQGRMPQQRVFLDSPMAIAATRVYRRHSELLDAAGRERLGDGLGSPQDWLPQLRFAETPEESMAINKISGGAVVIAGSGMCNGGRVRHHLKYNLWRREAHVVICGFQAAGTPGRALVDGARKVRLLGAEIAVRAAIHTLGGFSAHMGQSGLVRWVGRAHDPTPRLHLVHGEPEKQAALAERIARDLGHAATPVVEGKRIAIEPV